MKTNIIMNGDCIEHMKELPENSVDAIITDPPYGLEFMGKNWDHGVPGKVFFIEMIRVLKPGGFLLSFGGTRTYHRLVCGIEDAGFEIRDTIMWLYGSGFPKSLNIGKQIDKKPEVLYTLEFKKWLGEQIEKCSKPKKQINDECGFTATSYCKTDGKDYWSSNFPSKEKWAKMKEVIGLPDDYDFVIRDNLKERGFIEPTGNLHKGSGDNIQFSGKQLSNNSISEYAKQWEGWGTALKPACEPIVVARKPLSEKNVALNVLKWGTGGINIDDCRIGTNPNVDDMLRSVDRKKRETETWEKGSGFKNENNSLTGVRPDGRFPANIILDEEAGKMLDEQSGETAKGHWAKSKVSGYGEFGGGKQEYFGKGDYAQDKGGASRFFYCAKASKSERNFGCEDSDIKEKLNSKMFRTANNTSDKTSKGFERFDTLPSKNNHPTVKPIKIMEYLIKLVSREGAIVLDPFLGSGTTAIACLKLNRNFIGIEKESEYIKIAEARIKPYLEQTKLFASTHEGVRNES